MTTTTPRSAFAPAALATLFISLGLAFAPSAVAAPVITSVSGCTDVPPGTEDCPAAGGTALTVHGVDFGAVGGAVLVGTEECSGATWDPTEVVCTLPAGTGTQQVVRVIDSTGGISPGDALVSYTAPQITGVSGCFSGSTDCNRAGGTVITVQGSDFGPADTQVLVDGEPCPHNVAQSDFEIRCTLPPGTGADKPLTLVTRGGGLNTDSSTISYEPCGAGSFVSGNSCSLCPPGFFSNTADAESCTPCPAGRFSDQSGLQICDQCAIGEFQASEGQISCDVCPAGSSSTAKGATTCAERGVLQCWKAKDLKTPKFIRTDDIPLDDELSSGTLIDTKKPTHVCLPGDLAAGGIPDPSAYQCCYKIKGDKLDPPANVDTTDAIGGGLSIELKKRDLVCEPCDVTVLP